MKLTAAAHESLCPLFTVHNAEYNTAFH